MAREGLFDDCGYDFCECDCDCSECNNKKCVSYKNEESEEEK